MSNQVKNGGYGIDYIPWPSSQRPATAHPTLASPEPLARPRCQAARNRCVNSRFVNIEFTEAPSNHLKFNL